MAGTDSQTLLNIDTSSWQAVGATSNTEYFVPESGVLIAMPLQGAADDEVTAQENVDFHHAHWRQLGRSGASVILFDRMTSQDKGARGVYASQSDPSLLTCAALVGGTLLSRAMASFFIGLTRPMIPAKMFPDLDSALVWARQMNEQRSQRIER